MKVSTLSRTSLSKALGIALGSLLIGFVCTGPVSAQSTPTDVKWAERDVGDNVSTLAPTKIYHTEESAGSQPEIVPEGLSSLAREVSLQFRDVPFERALNRIADKGDISIAYLQEIVEGNGSVTLETSSISVGEALKAVLEGTKLKLIPVGQDHFVVTERSESAIEGSPDSMDGWRDLVSPPVRDQESTRSQDFVAPQEFTVSGTVTNVETGRPLTGVNVVVTGTQRGTATNSQGRYEIDAVTATDTLRFSFVGFEPQFIPIQERATIDVGMQPTTLTGGDVVVTGYSTQQKQDLTGSVEVVNTAELQNIAESQVADQLQGMASGVSVISSGQPGEDPQIRIRGVNTFGNNTPLYVVDGVTTQDISDLNSIDIESIQVLRDASAASVYGARAANGVIIIETQEGGDEVSVNVNSYAGISKQPVEKNPWDLLMSQGRADLEWMAFQNSGVEPSDPQYGDGEEPRLPDYVLPSGAMEGDSGTDPDDYFLNPFFSDPAEAEDFHQIVRANKDGTDWFDEIMRTAAVTKTDLSVSGGGEQGNYLFSMGYLNEEGTLLRTYLERFSLRANTSFDVGDNIRLGEKLSYTVSENMLANEEGDQAIMESFRMREIVPVRDIAGNWAGVAGDGLGNGANPVAVRERTRNDRPRDTRLFGNAFVEVNFLENFLFKSIFGGGINSGFFYDFTFPRYERGTLTNNSLSKNSWNSFNWTFSNTLNYNNSFAQNHNITVLVGAEWKKENDRFQQGQVNRFFSFDPDFVTLDNGSGSKSVSSGLVRTKLVSQFGKVDYNYARKYFVSGTLRRDGSSKFLTHRFGLFPAASIAWRISEESFMNGVFPWLTDLKIRAGRGIMGNQLNVNPNNAYTLFASNPYAYSNFGSNSTAEQGFFPSQVGAPNAKWEQVKDTNIGIDLAVFGGQFEATIDYYRKSVEDLLFNPERPGAAGQASAPFINVASMKNTGVDASLQGETEIGGVEITGGLNFTSYRNEITSIAEGFDSFSEDSRRFAGESIVRNEVGQEISSYYGYNIVGFWDSQDEINNADSRAPSGTYQNDAAPGRFKYEDIDGDGEITPDDRTFLGSPNPDFTAGLNLNFRYGNWNLGMSLYGSQGAEAWNNVKWFTHFFSSFNGAKSEVALNDSWTPDNRNASAPIQELAQSFSTNQVPNSYFVEDADYLRIQNLRLGYTLPSSVIQGFGGEQMNIYVQASNLYTFTNYSNPDPEIGGDDPTDVTSYGIDQGRYITPRKFLAGISLTF